MLLLRSVGEKVCISTTPSDLSGRIAQQSHAKQPNFRAAHACELQSEARQQCAVTLLAGNIARGAHDRKRRCVTLAGGNTGWKAAPDYCKGV
eukprot:IDg16376t1